MFCDKKGACEMENGDIYAYKTPNEFYSTIRILKVAENKLFFYVTRYYDAEIPQLENERLYLPYDASSIRWVEKNDVEDLILIGYKSLNEQEAKLIQKAQIAYNKSLLVTILIPYYKWFNKNGLAMLKEMPANNLRQEDETTLPEKAFWEVIEQIQLDADDPLKKAREKLESFTGKQMEQFEETLACKLYKLDTKKHAREIGEHAFHEESGYFSPDYFLYIRCLCVAKGKTFYNKVLRQPCLMPKDEGFEELLELTHEAYEEKTGEEFDYIPSKDYETFSNKEGWK